MSLFDRIIIYLDSKGIDYTEDDVGIDGKVVLVDNADGKGPQIVKWEFEAPIPSSQELAAISIAEIENKKDERENRAKQLSLPIFNQLQIQRFTKRLEKGVIWYNKDLKKLQLFDGKDIITL